LIAAGDFSPKNADAARRAGVTISKHFLLLETSPTIGCPLDNEATLREFVIPLSAADYIALYRDVRTESAVSLSLFAISGSRVIKARRLHRQTALNFKSQAWRHLTRTLIAD